MNLKRNDTLAKCLRNLGTATPGEAEQISPDTASSSAAEISTTPTQQGAKSPSITLLALLALPHSRDLAVR
jgi:hypothetical protein